MSMGERCCAVEVDSDLYKYQNLQLILYSLYVKL